MAAWHDELGSLEPEPGLRPSLPHSEEGLPRAEWGRTAGKKVNTLVQEHPPVSRGMPVCILKEEESPLFPPWSLLC